MSTHNLIGRDFNAFFLYKTSRSDIRSKIVIVKIDNASLDVLVKTDFRVLTVSKKIFIASIRQLRKAGAKAIGIDVVLVNPDPDEKALANVLAEKNDTVIAAKIGGSGEEQRVLPHKIYPLAFWGMLDVFFDKNIVTKLKPLVRIDQTTEIEHFAIAIYKRFIGSAQMGQYELRNKQKIYRVNPIRTLSVDEGGFTYIPFTRKIGEYPSISLHDLLSGNFDPDFFRDAIVLVGEHGTLIHDAHFSPISFGKKMPGVEFHAQFIESLLNNTPIHHLPTLKGYTIGFLLGFLSLGVMVFARMWVIILYCVSIPVCVLIVGWYLHTTEGILIPLYLWMSVAWLFPLFGGALYRYFIVDSKRRFLANAFGHYIAPEVVANLSLNPEALMLGGSKQEIAILFSDIAGFTSISETLGIEGLFSLISEYLSEMTDILLINKGTLDKYIGDAVMGFYGAPISIDTPAYWACKTAIEQQNRLEVLGIKWKEKGIPPVHARIGIHFGEAMIGNIGSKNRFNYTAMGDSVNISSRLEGVNKVYGTFICVSQDIVERAGDEFVFRKLDTIRVKGKIGSVNIYELVGWKRDMSIQHDMLSTYAKGLERYVASDFAGARTLFLSIPQDPPACIMQARCLSLLAGKTHLHNGVFEMLDK